MTLGEFCLALSKSLKLCSWDTSHRAVIRPLYLTRMPSAARLGICGQTDGPIKPEARGSGGDPGPDQGSHVLRPLGMS